MLMLENLCLTPQMSYKRPLHTTHQTAKIFRKKIGEKIVAQIKTVEKIVAVVKKSCSVYGRSLHFFAVLCVVCLCRRLCFSEKQNRV
mgnify:CR=1 FL=1